MTVVYATYMIGQTLLLCIKVQNCQDITNVSETCKCLGAQFPAAEKILIVGNLTKVTA